MAALVSAEGNRWSRRGEPTIYLALDPIGALAELARHLTPGESAAAASVWTVRVSLKEVVEVSEGDAGWILDAERCRVVAAEHRQRGVDGLLVPSVAFLDRPERRNLVIFVERLDDLDKAISDPRRILSVVPVADQDRTHREAAIRS